ncbi:MAG: DUF5777 family beta-barrel protein [Bacteroidota bacterium]
MKKIAAAIIILMAGSHCFAQTNQEEPAESIFRGTRLVNEHSVNLPDKGELLFLIQHRFGEIGGGFYELFGLDKATMRLGFEYGFGNNLSAGFGRSSWLKTYDLFIKSRFAQQHQDFPFTLGAVAKASIPTLRNYFPQPENSLSSKSAAVLQLMAAKTIGKFGFQISPGILSTGYLHSQNGSILLLTTGVAGSVKLSELITASVEYLPSFHSSFSSTNPLSIGVDINTRGHLFQLILSNSQQMFTQALYTATQGSWSEGRLFFGFNLIREFRIKYY